jgi:hypothetical protein
VGHAQRQEVLATSEISQGPEEAAEQVSKLNDNNVSSEGGGGGGKAKATAAASKGATESPHNGQGLVLSQRALDLLFIACPPPPSPLSGRKQRMGAAVSAVSFLDSEPSDIPQNAAAASPASDTAVPLADPSSSLPSLLVPRPCISFADFASRPEVQQWVKLGWLRLRDLGATLGKLRATSE